MVDHSVGLLFSDARLAKRCISEMFEIKPTLGPDAPCNWSIFSKSLEPKHFPLSTITMLAEQVLCTWSTSCYV